MEDITREMHALARNHTIHTGSVLLGLDIVWTLLVAWARQCLALEGSGRNPHGVRDMRLFMFDIGLGITSNMGYAMPCKLRAQGATPEGDHKGPTCGATTTHRQD